MKTKQYVIKNGQVFDKSAGKFVKTRLSNLEQILGTDDVFSPFHKCETKKQYIHVWRELNKPEEENNE